MFQIENLLSEGKISTCKLLSVTCKYYINPSCPDPGLREKKIT